MRDILTAAIAAIVVFALGGTAFAGGTCTGPKGQHQSAETAAAGQAVHPTLAMTADDKAVVWPGTANIGTSLGMAESVTTNSVTAVSKATMTKKTMAESIN